MNQTDILYYINYANKCMDSYESMPCEDRLILAKISLNDNLEIQNSEREFDKSLLRLINLYRTSEFSRD